MPITPTATPAPDTDLSYLDTTNAHYIAGTNGLTEVRLYNAQVGLPSRAGWRFRDPGLRPTGPVAANSVAPVDLALRAGTARR